MFRPTFQAQITIPPKATPYTQPDMDIVIGHPIILTMGIRGEGKPTSLVGTVLSAEIQDDGSALVTMEVTPP